MNPSFATLANSDIPVTLNNLPLIDRILKIYLHSIRCTWELASHLHSIPDDTCDRLRELREKTYNLLLKYQASFVDQHEVAVVDMIDEALMEEYHR